MRQAPKIVLGVCISAAFLFGCYTYWLSKDDTYHEVASLDCGNNRKVVLFSKPSMEDVQQPLSMRVFEKNVEVASSVWLDLQILTLSEGQHYDLWNLDSFHYQVMSSKDGDVVGMAIKEMPYVIFAFYDFKTGKTWPPRHDVSKDKEPETLRQMRGAIEAAHPETSFRAKINDRAYMENRWRLVLSDSDINDDDLEKLSHFRQIRELDLSRTDVTKRGLQYLTNLPNMDRLIMHDSKIGDESIDVLKQLQQVGMLNMIGSRLTEEGCAEVRKALSSKNKIINLTWDELR